MDSANKSIDNFPLLLLTAC